MAARWTRRRLVVACLIAARDPNGATAPGRAAPVTPAQPATPNPQPPAAASAFPELTEPGAAYRRTSPTKIPGASRLVLYDDSLCALQYSRPDYGLLQYTGR